MALDETTKAIIDLLDANFPALGTEVTDAEQARAMLAPMRPPSPELGLRRIEDLEIRTDDGRTMAARGYWPPTDGPHTGMVFFHGGGFVLGDLDGHDALARRLCAGADAVVISVGYRLAPEHRFPAAAEDALAATTWVARNAAELDMVPGRLVVAGDSAGGNIAAVSALMARESGAPFIAAQLLIYPVLDGRMGSVSYTENGSGYFLTATHMRWFWEQYLGDQSPEHPYASPVVAERLEALPPAVIVVGEHDPVRDEGRAYAERLRAAGVEVELLEYDGMFHGFFGMVDALPTAKQAQADAYAALGKLLAGS